MKIIFHLPCISYFLHVSMSKDLQLINPSCLTSCVQASFRSLLQNTLTNFQVRVNPVSYGFPHVSSQSFHQFSAKGYQSEIKEVRVENLTQKPVMKLNLFKKQFLDFWVGYFILDKTLSLLKVVTKFSTGFKHTFFFKIRIFRQFLTPTKIWESGLLSCALLSSLVTDL